MDSLITAAARALAAGDPLGALKQVALRDDAAALALRGIAMAQLGDLARAQALTRNPAPADEGCTRLARPGRAGRTRGGYPRADGGGRKRIPLVEHARGTPDRARRAAPAPARGGRNAPGIGKPGRGCVPPCRVG